MLLFPPRRTLWACLDALKSRLVERANIIQTKKLHEKKIGTECPRIAGMDAR
jgi:hypothetical protein